jgi:hypothetical protein
MSKVMKTVQVPAHPQEQLDYISCELCSARTLPGQDGWEERIYDVLDVEIQLNQGYSYPGYYSTTATVLDICPKCFREKLMPWFVAQGGTVRTEE